MKRLGLVGVGAWGRRFVDTIARRNDCRIVAFARSSDRGGAVLPGIPQFPTWADLLRLKQKGDIDGVVVATTPQSQAEIAEAAISEGVPILVEKPLGLSAETVRQILRRYREAAVQPPVVVDFIHLWAPAYQALKARLLALPGGACSISSIDSEGCNRGPFRPWSSLYDYGPHDLALCLDLIGMDASIRLRSARMLTTPDQADGELFAAQVEIDGVLVNLRLGNGAAAKSRLFDVRMNGGERFIYDDVRPHPFKLTYHGSPVPLKETSPLDSLLTYFLGLLGTSTGSEQPPGAGFLELSLKVGEILDEIRVTVAATRDRDGL